MTKRDKEEYQTLCSFIRNEILCYSPSMKFPRFLENRIKKLAKGDSQTKELVYSYKMILCSFMKEKDNIKYWISHKEFENENHKIAYMMAIVESNMNDIKKKVINLQNEKEKMKRDVKNNRKYSDIVNLSSERYQRKTSQSFCGRTPEIIPQF